MVKENKTIQDKLNWFEKNLSLKHLGRDIIGLQLLLFVSSVVASLLFIWIVNHAVASSNPEQVLQTAQTTSNNMFWFFYIGMNLLIVYFCSKAKKEANRTKEEIIRMCNESKEAKQPSEGDEEE